MADQTLSHSAGDQQRAPDDTNERYILTLSCPDRMGIVAAVSGFLADQGCDILDSAQFGDRQNGIFFLRISFLSTRGTPLAGMRTSQTPSHAQLADSLSYAHVADSLARLRWRSP